MEIIELDICGIFLGLGEIGSVTGLLDFSRLMQAYIILPQTGGHKAEFEVSWCRREQRWKTLGKHYMDLCHQSLGVFQAEKVTGALTHGVKGQGV